MTYPNARIRIQVHRVNAMLATVGPLTPAANNEMLDRIEDVLQLAGYSMLLHEQAGWTFREPNGTYSFLWFETDIEILRYAYSHFVGEPDTASQENANTFARNEELLSPALESYWP